MSELPDGWAGTKLADIGRWSSGGTPSRGRPDYFGQGTPWVKSGDLPDGLIIRTEEQITDLGLKNSSAKLMPAGTISMALYGATIGKLGLLTFRAATNQACANVVPNKEVIDPQYLFFYLMSERRILIDKGQGGAQPNISQEIVKTHPIVLAPLNEQRRIVAKLERVLSRVDAAQARLATIPGILKRFRQSVLAAACSGRLTTDWRAKNPTLTASLNDRLSPGNGLPESWSEQLFSDSIADSFYGPRFSKESYALRGVPTIRTTDMGFDGSIAINDSPCLQLSNTELEKYCLQHGDLLVTRTGATIGKCALYDKSLGPAIPSAYLIRFRLKTDVIAPKFALFSFMSPTGQSLLVGGSTAVAQPNVNATTISQFVLAVPPLDEQQEIVRRVETLFKTADALEARYRKAKTHVDKLTQSILAKAFRGELVPQDPNDEPASILLERIYLERNGTSPKKKRGPRK